MKQEPGARNQKSGGGSFNSRIGVILAAAGSAIGLGNIWKFPYEMGDNGGGAFLLVYLLCVLLFGLPLMMTEFLLGKQSGKSAIGAFRTLCGNNKWQWLSYWCFISTAIFLGFYFVITGWCGSYLFEAASDAFAGLSADGLSAHFQSVVSNSGRMMWFVVLPIVLSSAVLWFDVTKGLERVSKVLMPLLLVLMIVMIIYVLCLDGSSAGLKYMFHIDFSHLTAESLMIAVGQCFFSLSIGAGMMIIFGAYMPSHQDATVTSMTVCTLDTTVALLAGMIIFPAVFAFGLSPQEGPQLVYVVLPAIFQQMPLSQISSTVFFLLLLVAALSSTIAIMEVLVANVLEMGRGKLNRHHAVLIAAGISLAMAVPATLSLSDEWSGLRIGGKNLFECLDMLVTDILLPVGALSMALFAGWIMPKRYNEFVPVSKKPWKRFLRPALVFALKWIVPTAILIIVLNGFGLLDSILK